MNRSILIVTPYFAPQSHAAVFRAYKLAKLLPRFGWKPYVLTVDTNYLYNEDWSLTGRATARGRGRHGAVHRADLARGADGPGRQGQDIPGDEAAGRAAIGADR